MNNQTEQEYWFPAKTYGWGWGVPTRWQGWLVLLMFVVALIAISTFFPPATNVLAFSALVGIASSILVLICLYKGEPPRWRWGK
jgi:uncharacterized membrane protein YhaH (DUF805 family)